MSGALADVRVLEFAWAVAGPATTRPFAQHGATVVKVETSNRLDGTRAMGPFRDKPGRNRSGYYALYNHGKLSVTLNLHHPRGHDVVRRLVRWADVVNENFSAGQMERWGLGYEDLAKIKPEIIMLRSSMQGQAGPHAQHRAAGMQLQGLVGLTHLTGWPDRAPSATSTPYTDVVGPWFGAVAILAAIDQRDRTGQGQCIDLSQYEASLQVIAPAIMEYAATGREPTRRGNRSLSMAPHGVYRCDGDDEWCAIAVRDDDDWRRMRRAMDAPGWTDEARFATSEGRLAAADELDRLVESWTVPRSAEEVMTTLQSAGVPAGAVRSCAGLFEDPQLAHRAHFVPLEHPVLGPFMCDAPAFRLSRTPADLGPAAAMGMHNEHVYKTVLGMPDDEYESLHSSGVFD